jgi:hypothetical protein
MTRIAGIGCLLGGLFFALDFMLFGWLIRQGFVPLETSTTLLLRTILWCAVSLLLLGGSLGLWLTGATGRGWTRKLGYCGIVFTLLGAISYIVGSLYIYSSPGRATRQYFTPLGSVVITIGMLKLMIAVLKADIWSGWRKFVPVPVALYFPLQFPLQAILFFGAGRGPNPFLLGAWGISWMLLGWTIWTSEPASEDSKLGA